MTSIGLEQADVQTTMKWSRLSARRNSGARHADFKAGIRRQLSADLRGNALGIVHRRAVSAQRKGPRVKSGPHQEKKAMTKVILTNRSERVKIDWHVRAFSLAAACGAFVLIAADSRHG